MINLGDFPTGATVYVPFATYDKDDGSSITMTGLAITDIEIYKNGVITQRASDNGYTLLDTDGIDFDGITGLHGFKIDLSDNSDSGFYAAGNEYQVAVSAITVDAVTINFWAAIFSIEKTGGVLALLKTNLDATVSSRLASASYTAPDNASISAILTDTGTDGVVVATASKTGYALSTAGVDAVLDDVVEGTLTLRHIIRILLAGMAGKSSGGGTATILFKGADGTTTRITGTVDADGNRSAVIVDGA